MERYIGNFYALLLHLLKKLLRPMESCSRCRRRAFFLCIDGIVSCLIAKLFCDIRRKRHFSKLIQDFLKYAFKMKLYNPVAVFLTLDHCSRK